MNKKLIGVGRCNVVFFDDVVDVSHSGANKERKDESKDVVTSSPEVDVDGIEDGKEREPPRDTINNCFLAIREELVYNSTEKQSMDERPDEERPRRWSDVGLLSIEIKGRCYYVDI